MGHVSYQVLRERRNELERNPTQHEIRFRNRLVSGKVKFQFQVLIPPYIVDFLIPKRHLIIELDGSQHLEPERAAHDKRRDGYLASHGFAIVRIPNVEVMEWPLKNIRKYPRTKNCARAVQNLIDEYKSRNGSITRAQQKGKSRIIKEQPPRKIKCSACGGWCFLFDGNLGPHLLRGNGRPCANKVL